jgi:TfoX/Sxy family transcriptional regulator of competence genes
MVDKSGKTLYNTLMNLEKPTRKKRTDRNHIVYELIVNGKNYIGVTAKTESTIQKSVKARAAKHFYRAKTESKDWLLCAELRKLNSKEEIEILIHAVIRGKAEAHKTEVAIRRAVKPQLNTDTRGD